MQMYLPRKKQQKKEPKDNGGDVEKRVYQQEYCDSLSGISIVCVREAIRLRRRLFFFRFSGIVLTSNCFFFCLFYRDTIG